MKNLLRTTLACCLLQGCGPEVHSSVTRFHDGLDTSKTFVVLPTDKQKNNLEYQQVASQVAAQLQQHGLTPATESRADYGAFIAYGIDDGRTVTDALPIMGQTGGGTTYHSGSINTMGSGLSSYSGTSYSPATFGVVGMMPVSTTLYAGFLRLDIYDIKPRRRDPKKIFEGTVKSESTTGVFSAVSECLVQSLFKDFPGVSGKTTDIRLPIDSCVSAE